jgi:hypothetical protein
MNGEKVSLDKVDSIIKQPRWLPSSRFATFEIMVVTNQVKQKIREIGWNQSVITDCSICLCLQLGTYTAERINKPYQ